MLVTGLPSRRGVLQAAAAGPLLLLAACSSDGGEQTPDADDAVRSDVSASEQRLLARYDATIAAFPALAGKLQPIRDQHAEHLAAMGSQPTNRDENGPAVGKTPAGAISDLTAAERSAATERVKASGQASSAELIWNLALIAASESQHATALARGSA